MNQFQRGRELRHRLEAKKKLIEDHASEGEMDAIMALAVHPETGKQEIVGVALTMAGVAELVAESENDYSAWRIRPFPVRMLHK